MPTLDSKYMEALEMAVVEGRKTRQWQISSIRSGDFLGWVGWYGPWRQYCFYPDGGAVFNGECLLSIVKFLKEATAEHKRKIRRA